MTTFAPYHPAGTTRTSKKGIARHVPLLPNHFNHRWFDAYISDFLGKNILENNGVLSGCVISQDGGNDAINITSGEVVIGDTKVSFTAPSTYTCAADGWYSVYIDNTGTAIFGFMKNDTVQGALTPDNSILVGYALRGGGVFYIVSFFNEITDFVNVLDSVKHIQPDIIVGPSLTDSRATNVESDFIAALSAGDKILFISGVILTASRVLTTESQIWMDRPDVPIDLATFNLTLAEVSGHITVISTTGKLILNGRTHGLIINGTVDVTQGAGFSGTYFKNGKLITNKVNHIWGTSAQVTARTADFYTDASGNPLDKDGGAVTISDGEKIIIAHDAVATANMLLNCGGSKVVLEMAKGLNWNLGTYNLDIGVTAGDSFSGTIDLTGSGTLTVLKSNLLKINHTAMTVTVTGDAVINNVSNLKTPVIASIENSGVLTLPSGIETLVGRDTTDTLTNKTIEDPIIIGSNGLDFSVLGGSKLNIYKEGTFTPSWLFSVSQSFNYSAQLGRYIKIGKLLFVSVYLEVDTMSSASGYMKIDGLPFAPVTLGITGSGDDFYSTSIHALTNTVTEVLYFRIRPGDTFGDVMIGKSFSVATETELPADGNSMGFTMCYPIN